MRMKVSSLKVRCCRRLKAIEFVESGNDKEAIITNLENAYHAFDKQAGTHIHK